MLYVINGRVERFLDELIGASRENKKPEENTTRKTERKKTERSSFDKARKTTILFEEM